MPNRERRWLIVRILGRTAELSRSIQMSSCVTPRTWLGPRSSRSHRSRKKNLQTRAGHSLRGLARSHQHIKADPLAMRSAVCGYRLAFDLAAPAMAKRQKMLWCEDV